MSSSQYEIKHFSHPHPLLLANHQDIVSCSGCTLNASGWIYTCKACNYFLHVPCSQMPEKTRHPCDHTHLLSLLPKPRAQTAFCNACRKLCNGFSYVCRACNIDLHIACAAMPLLFTHQLHHHQLSLTFSPPPPPPNKICTCDVCQKRVDSHQWRYRCNLCDFDAHLSCAITNPWVPGKAGTTEIAPLFW